MVFWNRRNWVDFKKAQAPPCSSQTSLFHPILPPSTYLPPPPPVFLTYFFFFCPPPPPPLSLSPVPLPLQSPRQVNTCTIKRLTPAQDGPNDWRAVEDAPKKSRKPKTKNWAGKWYRDHTKLKVSVVRRKRDVPRHKKRKGGFFNSLHQTTATRMKI